MLKYRKSIFRSLHMKFIKTSLLLSLLLSDAFGSESLSSSTKHALFSLAPKGHWAIEVERKNRTTQKHYNNSGKESLIGEEYNGINLNQDIFPSLAIFGEGATLGKTQTDMALDFDYTTLRLGYGVTKDLTIGVIVPYREKRTKVNFSISDGNIGLNPNFNATQSISAQNSPYLPTSVAGVTPLTTAQLQDILASKGLEYKPLETIERSGFADPTVGLIYNAYSSSEDAFVLSLGYNIPMAEKDDPDVLIPTNIGDGNPTLRLRLEYFKDLEYDFDLYGKFEYGLELEDKVTKRVPKEGEFLAPKSSTERLNRDIGDYRIYNVGVGKTWGEYRASVAWRKSEKDADTYYSAKGTDVSMLENNTVASSSQFEGSLSWSGVDAWREGTMPLPLVVTLNYRDRYEGKNSLKWQEVYLNVTSFF